MTTTAPQTTEANINLPIEGMTCASCVGRVEKTLSAMDGVQDAQVSYALGRATVTYDPTRTSPKILAEAVMDAGYEVPATESTTEIGVIGMTCAARVRRVDKALRAVEGVLDANVNLAAPPGVWPRVIVDAEDGPAEVCEHAVAAASGELGSGGTARRPVTSCHLSGAA